MEKYFSIHQPHTQKFRRDCKKKEHKLAAVYASVVEKNIKIQQNKHHGNVSCMRALFSHFCLEIGYVLHVDIVPPRRCCSLYMYNSIQTFQFHFCICCESYFFGFLTLSSGSTVDSGDVLLPFMIITKLLCYIIS